MIHRALKKSFYIHSYILLDFPLRKPITFVVILMYLQCQWSIDSMCVGLGLFGMIDVNALSYSLKLVDCLWKEIVLACRKRLYMRVGRDCTYCKMWVLLRLQYLVRCLLNEFVLIPRLFIFVLANFFNRPR